ncbi:uncharacterized protein JCM15063_005034 [Sporobolomyces koalae]|uniref:uncharacterized protein n=1 Tax=Sporobolomyces koalae TaxID=500713 RepID=UPI0031752E97
MAEPHYVELVVVYSGGMIVLSWLVAVVGSWTTLEILLRRTSNHGATNVWLLLGAGIAFGSTATFGMHFVGNQAVSLKLPAPWTGQGVPLSYNPGFTILSLVISCLCMILAFSFIGLRFRTQACEPHQIEEGLTGSTSHEREDMDDKLNSEYPLDVKERPETGQTDQNKRHRIFSSSSLLSRPPPAHGLRSTKHSSMGDSQDEEEDLQEDGGDFGVHTAKVSRAGVAKIIGAGVICGGGIAAMHYVGQVSINSVPRVTNDWYTVLASILIAMSAVSVGLYILFVVFRPKLQHSWYKRLAVAMILGAAVCGMHFVALLGTHYYAWEGTDLTTPADSTTKIIIISIICVVAPICCISLLVFAYIAQLRHARQRAARHRIILSSAIFDQQGLLLVDPESGLLPTARIYASTTKEAKPSVLNFFGMGNRSRLRLDSSKVKVGRSDPAFAAFLQRSWEWRARQQPVSGAMKPTGWSSDPLDTTIEAPDSDETKSLDRSLVSFQMASEEVAMQITGSTDDLRSIGVLCDSILKTGHYQVSSTTTKDKFVVTQGQMLCLARRLKSSSEREKLLARGFVFAEPGAVARLTSNALACPYDRVLEYFREAHKFTRFGMVKKLDRGRLFGALLLLQAKPGEGLQVVVDEKVHHSLPMIEIASLINPSLDRLKQPASAFPVTTLDKVLEGIGAIGGCSLEELSTNVPNSSSFDAASQLHFIIAHLLRPQLDRTFGTTIPALSSRIRLASTVVPLSSRAGPPYGPDGLTKDSYLICFQAVIPASVAIPGRPLNWLPFSLYRAQADAVAQVPASSSHRPGTAASVISGSSPFDARSRHSSTISHDPGEDEIPFPLATASPFSTTAFPPRSFSASSPTSPPPPPPDHTPHPRYRSTSPPRPSQSQARSRMSNVSESDEIGGNDSSAPAHPPSNAHPSVALVYTPDWVLGLLKNAMTDQDWGDVPRRSLRSRPPSQMALRGLRG